MARLVRDSWLMFASQLRITLRNPVWVFIGLFQPICYMLLFAPLLKNLANTPGFPKGGAYNIFTPGLMMMMAIFGTGFAGFNLIARLQEGVIERLRVTPINRLAMLLGIIAVDLLNLLVQTSLLVGVGALLGFRPDVGGLLVLLALLLVAGLMMASFSYTLALMLKEQGALAATINLFTLPLLLLSGIMLPLSLAPDILRKVANVNPFAYAVDAARALAAGHVGDLAVSQAFLILGVLAVLTLWWATSSVRRATV